MIWLNFLHFYQPVNQQPDILDAVVKQCYRPIFSRIKNIKKANITLNISGSLIELLDKNGYTDVINDIRTSVENKKIELTGSCKYHALLPLIPESEVVRQIKENEKTLRKYFGDSLNLNGFFPPEMAYDDKLSGILSDLGYEWVLVDEIANPEGYLDGVTKHINISEKSGIKIFFRIRRISNLIMSAVVRDTESFKNAIKHDLSKDGYLLTGMDGETFGHHRINFDDFLFKLLDDKEIIKMKISEYVDEYNPSLENRSVSPITSTWASSPEDIKKGIQFISWKDKDNIIHKYQWEMLEFCLDLVNNLPSNSPKYETIRRKMDQALASDHFFWASGKPWWALEMIESGAYALLDIVRDIPGISDDNLKKASQYYEKIVSISFEWQRTGKIRKMAKEQNQILRLPFKERTLERGGEEEAVYNAFIDTMKEQELISSKKGDYERAILWRDAIYKLENKLDIYDTINVIDLLRIEISNERMEEIIKKYKEEYLRIRGGQPEQRGS